MPNVEINETYPYVTTERVHIDEFINNAELTPDDFMHVNPHLSDIEYLETGTPLNIPIQEWEGVSEDTSGVPIEWAEKEFQKGVSEYEGDNASNPEIEKYHKSAGGVAPDDVPWCSSFVNWCVSQTGVKGTNNKAARSWHNWGEETSSPSRGDIVVFKRKDSTWKGHVGFYWSETEKNIQVLGGNQSNSVKLSYYPKNGTKYALLSIRETEKNTKFSLNSILAANTNFLSEHVTNNRYNLEFFNAHKQILPEQFQSFSEADIFVSSKRDSGEVAFAQCSLEIGQSPLNPTIINYDNDHYSTDIDYNFFPDAISIQKDGVDISNVVINDKISDIFDSCARAAHRDGIQIAKNPYKYMDKYGPEYNKVTKTPILDKRQPISGSVSKDITIDNCTIHSNGMLQGIFSSDGLHENLTITNNKVRTESTHEIAINGLLSGVINNNYAIDEIGTQLRDAKILLYPLRLGGKIDNLPNLWVTGFSDGTEYSSENIEGSNIVDLRSTYSGEGTIINNFNLAQYKELYNKPDTTIRYINDNISRTFIEFLEINGLNVSDDEILDKQIAVHSASDYLPYIVHVLAGYCRS